MSDQVKAAADYISAELDKLDAPINYAACLIIARHLQHMFEGKPEPNFTINVAQNLRKRYEGEDYEHAD